MSYSDDMVIDPDLGGAGPSSARARARMERRLQEQAKPGGVLSRSAKIAARRHAAGIAADVYAAKRIRLLRPAAALRGSRVAARGVATPVGLIAAGVIVAGVVALRLGSGQPLEGVGEQINQWILGDADEEARAKMNVRGVLSSDPELQRSVLRSEDVMRQVNRLGRDLYEMELDTQKGASLIRRAFPVDGTIDILILRARDAFMRYIMGSSVPKNTVELRHHLATTHKARSATMHMVKNVMIPYGWVF